MQINTLQATLVLLCQLSIGANANYESGKAVQINFYKDATCTNYAGEMAFWHAQARKSPKAGIIFPISDPEDSDCWDFRQASGAQSLNIAGCWETNGSTNKYCNCQFWDNWGCTGNRKSISTTKDNCVPGRASSGYQWKSAKCSMERSL